MTYTEVERRSTQLAGDGDGSPIVARPPRLACTCSSLPTYDIQPAYEKATINGQHSFLGRGAQAAAWKAFAKQRSCAVAVCCSCGGHTFLLDPVDADMCTQLPIRSGRIHGNAEVSKSSRLTMTAEEESITLLRVKAPERVGTANRASRSGR